MKNKFTILVDSREKKPYSFSSCDCLVEVAHLVTGDYSVAGLKDEVAIERKSKADAYGTIGQARARFEDELRRMANMDYAAIVVESSMADFLKPPAHSELHPNSAINSLLAWSVRYGVHVFFCDDRQFARATTYRLLEKYWLEAEKKNPEPTGDVVAGMAPSAEEKIEYPKQEYKLGKGNGKKRS